MKSVLLSLSLICTAIQVNAQAPDTTLQSVSPMPVGAAVSVPLLKTNAQYRALVEREYNSLTPENAMKFSKIHPGLTTYNWADADTLVAFAQQTNKRIHGHTLIWHTDLPGWVTSFSGDSAAWENMMKTHITTIVSRYKGVLTSWDVVNEAVDETGALRNSIWAQHLGPNYVTRAFQYAHDADSAAILFYNDAGHEYNIPKLNGILRLMDTLIAQGAPIHGMGLQMHMNRYTSNTNVDNAIDSVIVRGLKVHLSELDIAVNPNKDMSLTYNPLVASQQFAKYKYIPRKLRSLPASLVYGITSWNVTDADSWVPGFFGRPDYPLLFDGSFNKKYSYYGFKDGLSTEWNFDASNGESFAGTYTDLGTNGTAITTNFSGNVMGYDTDNSSVQQIGFDFVFNGSVYKTFVLNTNGFIRLGYAPPSSSAIFYPTYNGNAGSVITAVNDIDLIYPYNHDLKAGSGTPEYRVYTSGSTGSRVCTIQFKNLADKLSPTQYSNMEFQIKLYETSNQIEFVYGTWVAGPNATTGITAAVGIKGVNAAESVNIARWSNIPWDTTLSIATNYYFKNGNYASGGPQFNTQKSFLPDAGHTFRFSNSSAGLRPFSQSGARTFAITNVKAIENSSFDVKVSNPFKESINIQIRSREQQHIRIALFSMNGQLLQHKMLHIPAGVNLTTLQTPSMTPGVYVLKVYSAEGERAFRVIRN